MTKQEIRDLFGNNPGFVLSVAFTDISHYNARVIHWEAHNKKHCKFNQWIAYHMLNHGYIQGRLYLIFLCKAFDENSGVIDGKGDPLRYNLPPDWGQCDYQEE